MSLTIYQWHARFEQQAGWTSALRQHLFERLGLKAAQRVMEVGCGTGAVLAEIRKSFNGRLYGLDINPGYLGQAGMHSPLTHLVVGDAHCLPCAGDSFDLVCCHFLLLWVEDPSLAVAEMARLARSGGAVLLMAEPDYGGRIDYPQELGLIGRWQEQSLRLQGANPLIGRRLASLLLQAGLEKIETGVLGGSWTVPPSRQEWELEWQVLHDDLKRLPQIWETAQGEIAALQVLDWEAWQRRERILFVPTFYAWGRKA